MTILTMATLALLSAPLELHPAIEPRPCRITDHRVKIRIVTRTDMHEIPMRIHIEDMPLA